MTLSCSSGWIGCASSLSTWLLSMVIGVRSPPLIRLLTMVISQLSQLHVQVQCQPKTTMNVSIIWRIIFKIDTHIIHFMNKCCYSAAATSACLTNQSWCKVIAADSGDFTYPQPKRVSIGYGYGPLALSLKSLCMVAYLAPIVAVNDTTITYDHPSLHQWESCYVQREISEGQTWRRRWWFVPWMHCPV